MKWESADVWQPVWGIKEIAAALDARRQTVATWYLRGKLPTPDAQLGMGPVWFGGEVAAQLDKGDIEPWIALRIESELRPPQVKSEHGTAWAGAAATTAQRLFNGPLVQAFSASLFRAAADGDTFEEWHAQLVSRHRELREMIEIATDDLYGAGLWPWEPFTVDPTK